MSFLINPFIYATSAGGCSGNIISLLNLGGYYKMDGDSSDSSGNSFNGTDTDMSYGASDVNSNFGDGADFNGTSSFIDCGSHNEFEGSANTITVACWINSPNFAGPTHIASCRSSASDGWRFYMDGSNLAGTIAGTNNSVSATYATGITYHVAMTYDGSNLVEYWLDGVSQGTAAVGSKSLATTGNLRIGRNHANNGYWNGQIDDFSIWQRKLTDAEIGDLAAGGSASACPLDTP
jgi:hypothetical protein